MANLRDIFDKGEWDDAMAKLDGPLKESLARRMALAGAQVLRDEARARVPVDEGTLRANIYAAYDKKSTATQITYNVSWNRSNAPQGQWIEFGHFRVNELVQVGKGQWAATTKKLDAPVWVAAQPFLRPAFDAAQNRALQVMIRVGREELPKLLRGE